MPQAAMNSLNPVVRVGPQIRDGFRAHHGSSNQNEVDEMVVDVLQKVGLRSEVADRLPAPAKWWNEATGRHGNRDLLRAESDHR